MKKKSPRAVAAQIILEVLDQGKSLSTLIPEAQHQICLFYTSDAADELTPVDTRNQ